ncbi:hypothetical protein S245_066321, partial [Arachis hypogaea]
SLLINEILIANGFFSQGGRIQASINKGLFKKWRGFFEEFKMHTLSNLIVVEKMENIKTTTNRSTLNFSHRTVVVRVENPSFPLKPFCLNPIPELLAAKKLDDSQLLDIIGEVVGKEDPRDIITSKGKETKCMVVVIADLEVEPLIVVLQFFKPSRWNDKVSVQSHFNVSKIHVNPDMKE